MTLTLLTATGARPEAWAICEQLMLRQTYAGPVHWIVVDDCEVAQPVTFERDRWSMSIIRPTPAWKPGENTQARNLRAGMELVRHTDRLVIIEDDDCYTPQYLDTVSKWLDRYDLVGESYARYYNVRTKACQQLRNDRHASLCATAMKGEAIKAFRVELMRTETFIDVNLWRNFRGPSVLNATDFVTGIKGLPGRGGIGMGHRPDFKGQIDASGSILRQWTGANSGLYRG